MTMSSSNGQAPGMGLQVQGGAAIVAPVSAFPNGIPANALVVLPVQKPTEEMTKKLEEGPIVCTPEQMWELLGFNGPGVQVQDDQGRPIMIGLDDLLAGLEKHFNEKPEDLNRGRIFAQELLKHGRVQKAEQVLSKVVAKGGTGDDWLALGVSQLQQKKLDKAEGTLKGAQNLLKSNPYPALHLAKLYREKGEEAAAVEQLDKALELDKDNVDAWALLFAYVVDKDGEEKAASTIEERAKAAGTARPFVAAQAYYVNKKELDKAIVWATRATEADPNDALGLLSLSALYGQKGDLDSVVKLLSAHESKMASDVRLANNYFEALFQSRQIEKVTKLLNALAGAQNQQVKQFAIERSKLVAQFLQQQQQALSAAGQRR